MRRLWIGFYPALLAAAEKQDEEDAEVLAEILNSISECILILDREGLQADEVEKLGLLLNQQLDGYEKRREEREAGEADEDEDPEEVKEHQDDEMQEETGVLARISDIVHASFKVYWLFFFNSLCF